jgi:adenylate kinase
MFRDHKKRQTDLGKQVEEIMATGNLVPDSVTNDMVRERLGRDDVTKGALLDGYPRNVGQAKELDSIFTANGRTVSSVVLIEVPASELVQRILKRGKRSGRADDQDEGIIKNRLGVYTDQSAPCVAHYEGEGVSVHRIDGVGSVDEITSRILSALGLG